MTKQKKTLPGATDRVGAKTTQQPNQADSCTPILPHSAPKIKEYTGLTQYIPVGRENAISAKDLADICGYKNTRTLQQDIHSLRKNGTLILSATDDPKGYFMPADDDDVRRFVHSMDNRIRNTQIAVQAAREYMERR